jgi:hypothetical protein
MPMEIVSVYKAGVCNIGPAEIKARNRVGWIGLAFYIFLLVIFIGLNLSRAWRLVLFIPAFMSAMGFVQGQSHFCVHFGMSGLFNFDALGHEQTVIDPELRALDRKNSWRLIRYAVIIAVIVVAVGVVL